MFLNDGQKEKHIPDSSLEMEALYLAYLVLNDPVLKKLSTQMESGRLDCAAGVL